MYYIQYHILGHHAILMLCLNLIVEPTYLPYFSHETGTTNIIINFLFHLGLSYVVLFSKNQELDNRKIIFLFFNKNICCGYSKEPSQ